MGIAQLAEHWTVAPAVAGSIPVSHPIFLVRTQASCGDSRLGCPPSEARLLGDFENRGPVAQLDRASVFGTEGWGFDSLRGRQQAHPREINYVGQGFWTTLSTFSATSADLLGDSAVKKDLRAAPEFIPTLLIARRNRS